MVTISTKFMLATVQRPQLKIRIEKFPNNDLQIMLMCNVHVNIFFDLKFEYNKNSRSIPILQNVAWMRRAANVDQFLK